MSVGLLPPWIEGDKIVEGREEEEREIPRLLLCDRRQYSNISALAANKNLEHFD